MTVGIIYRVPGLGAVLGCDGRVSGNFGEILTDTDQKYLVGGSVIACCAGNLGGAWDPLIDDPPRTWADLRKRVARPLEAEWEYTLLAYCRRTDSLWLTDQDSATLRLGVYGAIGCGADLALGVLDASKPPRTLEAAEKLVRRAIAVACKRNSACGGRVRTVVARKGRSPVTER